MHSFVVKHDDHSAVINGLLDLWSVVTICIKCALTKPVCFVQRRFSSKNKVVLHNHRNRPTWLECSIVSEFFSWRNNRWDNFCIGSFSHNFYQLLGFFFCNGATLVFVRFMSWYALVLMLSCGSPALLFDVTASFLQMFCGGRVVKVKLASHLHSPCCCCHDFWWCFLGFNFSFGFCCGCRVAKQLFSVIW